MTRIAYDAELDRPGCALLQAGYGGDLGVESAFDTESGLLAPTPGLRVYEATPEQIARLAVRVNGRY